MFGIKSFEELKAKTVQAATAAASTVRSRVADGSDLLSALGGTSIGKDDDAAASSSALEEAQANVLKYKRILKKELGLKRLLENDRAEALLFIAASGILTPAANEGEEGISSDPVVAFPVGSIDRKMLLEGWSRALACAGLSEGAAAACQVISSTQSSEGGEEDGKKSSTYALPASAQVVAFENRAILVKEKMQEALVKLKEVSGERNALRIQLAEALVKISSAGPPVPNVISGAASEGNSDREELSRALEEQRVKIAALETSLSQANTSLKAAQESSNSSEKSGKALEAAFSASKKEISEARSELTAERHKFKGLLNGVEDIFRALSSQPQREAIVTKASEVGPLAPLLPSLKVVLTNFEALQVKSSGGDAEARALTAEAAASQSKSELRVAQKCASDLEEELRSLKERMNELASATSAAATSDAAAIHTALAESQAQAQVQGKALTEALSRCTSLEAQNSMLSTRIAQLGQDHGLAMEARALQYDRELESALETAAKAKLDLREALARCDAITVQSAEAAVAAEAAVKAASGDYQQQYALRSKFQTLAEETAVERDKLSLELTKSVAALAAAKKQWEEETVSMKREKEAELGRAKAVWEGKLVETSRRDAEERVRLELEARVGELTVVQGELSSAKKECRDAKATITQLKAQLSGAEDQIESLKESSDSVSLTRDELEKTKGALVGKSLECEALQVQVIDLTSRLSVAEESIKSIVSSTASADESSIRLSEEVGSLRVANEKMAVQLAAAQTQLGEVKAERDALEVSKAELKRRATNKLKEQKETLQAALTNTVEDYDSQIKAAEASRDAAFSELEVVKEAMEKVRVILIATLCSVILL